LPLRWSAFFAFPEDARRVVKTVLRCVPECDNGERRRRSDFGDSRCQPFAETAK
jgi:hypothetical protein